MQVKNIFHNISYLQYPILFAGVLYVIRPYFTGFETMLESYNMALIFMGLGISFSTLQDTTKTQNKFSKRIWENPKKGKTFLFFLSVSAALIIAMGLLGLYMPKNDIYKELALGMTVLGIGTIGLIKSAIEMFENHRLDKR